jgi:DNA-binding PadR family transcriptional regulator
MSLKMSILGLVSYTEMTGYDISRFFDGSLEYFFSANRSQIYRELTNLEKIGCLTARIEIQEGKPNKKLYKITKKGEDQLFDWLMEFDETTKFAQRLPIMSKIFFSVKIPESELRRTLESVKEKAKEKRTRLMSTDSNINDFHELYKVPEENFFYWEMTADFGISVYNLYINWADSCLKKLDLRDAQKTSKK